jgi:AraC-like DNA-binding protein
MLLQETPNPFIEMVHQIFGSCFRMHLFTSDGALYGLLCFVPPLQGELFQWKITNCCQRLADSDATLSLHLLVSKDEVGQQGIFHAANSLRHGLDYLRFFQESPQISFLDLSKQTSLGGSTGVDAYRKLAEALAEGMGDAAFQPEQSAREVAERLRAQSACSIESLHQQMQGFSLIFLNYLVEKAVIDKAFLRQHHIDRGIMDGDSQDGYVANLAEIFRKLHQRRQELKAQFNTERLSRISLYVEQNISSMELSVSQIADLYGVNRSQLTAQFRAYYGQSLSEFIYTKRLDRAKLLLESHPTWGLEQVAQEAGYCSLSTMYRAFQRSGLGTPASYRPK